MIRLLFLIHLFPVLVFGQTDKEKYVFTEAATFSKTTIVNECNFSRVKVMLSNTGDGQKIASDKGRYANVRINKCKLKTNNANWTLGSTEVKFKDNNGNTYWVYVDNDGLNFHDWVTNKGYFLYLKVLEGPNRLIFLDDIELGTDE